MPSSVGGIIDANGHIRRIVITEQNRLRFHVANGEQLIVLPDLAVQEPICWSEIPDVIQRVGACVTTRCEADQ